MHGLRAAGFGALASGWLGIWFTEVPRELPLARAHFVEMQIGATSAQKQLPLTAQDMPLLRPSWLNADDAIVVVSTTHSDAASYFGALPFTASVVNTSARELSKLSISVGATYARKQDVRSP